MSKEWPFAANFRGKGTVPAPLCIPSEVAFATMFAERISMTIDSVYNADDRIVVGYFSNSADASRAISELIDEGFQPVEIGAAFRTSRAAMEVTEGGRQRPTTENSAVTGSVGGPASHDEAVRVR